MEKTTKKLGRPALPPEILRSEVLFLKLSPPEKLAIMQAGGSAWAREVLLRAAKRVLDKSN